MKISRILILLMIIVGIAVAVAGMQDAYAGQTNETTKKLVQASVDGNIEAVKQLIGKGADVNAKLGEGATALMSASCNGHIDVVRLLIDKGADVNAELRGGGSAFMLAAEKGNAEIMKLLLDKGANVDVNKRDARGGTLLIWASGQGYTDIVKIMLDKGADVNAKTKQGVTALMVASYKGVPEIIKLLLDKGADVKAKDVNGRSALTLASSEGHADIVKLLGATEGKQSSYMPYLLAAINYSDTSKSSAIIYNSDDADKSLFVSFGDVLGKFIVKKINTDSVELLNAEDSTTHILTIDKTKPILIKSAVGAEKLKVGDEIGKFWVTDITTDSIRLLNDEDGSAQILKLK